MFAFFIFEIKIYNCFTTGISSYSDTLRIPYWQLKKGDVTKPLQFLKSLKFKFSDIPSEPPNGKLINIYLQLCWVLSLNNKIILMKELQKLKLKYKKFNR